MARHLVLRRGGLAQRGIEPRQRHGSGQAQRNGYGAQRDQRRTRMHQQPYPPGTCPRLISEHRCARPRFWPVGHPRHGGLAPGGGAGAALGGVISGDLVPKVHVADSLTELQLASGGGLRRQLAPTHSCRRTPASRAAWTRCSADKVRSTQVSGERQPAGGRAVPRGPCDPGLRGRQVRPLTV